MADLPAPSAPPAPSSAASHPPLAVAAPVLSSAAAQDAAPAATTRSGGIVARRRNRDGSLAVKLTTVKERDDGSREATFEHYLVPFARAVGAGLALTAGIPPGEEHLVGVERKAVPPGAAVVTSLPPEPPEPPDSSVGASTTQTSENAPRETGMLVLAPANHRGANRTPTSDKVFWCCLCFVPLAIVAVVLLVNGTGQGGVGWSDPPPTQPPTRWPTQSPTPAPSLPSYWYTGLIDTASGDPAGGGSVPSQPPTRQPTPGPRKHEKR